MTLSRKSQLGLVALGLITTVEAGAWAAEPGDVSGVVREETEPLDSARRAANVVLFIPRVTTELFFLATGTAVGLIEEEQVVPRVGDLLHPREDAIHLFPTAFMETGTSANVGARAIGRVGNVASSVRAGYGGPHDVVVESRLRLAVPRPLPVVLGLEALHDQRSSLGYLGLGQEPESDPRNRFLPTTTARSAGYGEVRERIIASLGVRPLPDLELFLSSSYARRHVDDPPASGDESVDDVFEPGSVPGFGLVNRLVYSEAALRVDTRDRRGGPATGLLFETYVGQGDSVGAPSTQYLRAGGRVAGFFDVMEPHNVLSPKFVLDGVSNLRGALPFIELPRQSDFRGFDTRRDFVSAVGSLDYRWTLARYLGARLFGDVATVAPRVPELRLEGLRWNAGFGIDVFSRDTQLGSIAVSGGPDGGRFMLRFGVTSGFGDRQHRG